MKIKVFNSGSSANGYAVFAGDEILLIECGVKTKEMLNGIGFDVSKVSGCLVSHSHSDHIRSVKGYLKYGFPVMMSEQSKPCDIAEITALKRMKMYNVGGFKVVPFRVPHSETECDGFYILHREFGKMVFITDAEMCPFNMSYLGINHLLIECNYDLKYVEMTDENKAHVLLGHMELQTCKRFIRTVYSENLKTIGLLHLSEKNADSALFKSEIQEEFPLSKVWIASKNTVMEG